MTMLIHYFCPRWGSEHLDWNVFFRQVKDAGYDGAECAVTQDDRPEVLHEVWDTAERQGVPIIPQHFDTYAADFNEHYDTYAAWLDKLTPFPTPKVNSQTGKDFFSPKQNQSLIALATEFTKSTGTAVVHETHRNKFSFAAHITKTYLEALPGLKITLDVSHWVNVAESYLGDQPEAMELAIARTEHIHARVGHPEGPQVPDPRAPEWEEAVGVHLAWWDRIVQRKKEEGGDTPFTITPEFGPYPYMTELPHTRQPIANQWDINEYMMNLLRERYG